MAEVRQFHENREGSLKAGYTYNNDKKAVGLGDIHWQVRRRASAVCENRAVR